MQRALIYVVLITILGQYNRVCSYPAPVIKTKHDIIEDVISEDNRTKSDSQCIKHLKNCSCHSIENVVRTKRDLHKIESNFVKKFFENNLDNDRKLRNSQSEENSKSADEDDYDDEENANKEKTGELVIKDKQFKEKQVEIANITNSTKFLFDKIENAKMDKADEEEDDKCCEEEDKKIMKALVAQSNRKSMGTSKSNDALEMHFYKNSPNVKSLKKNTSNNKPMLVSLYPDTRTIHPQDSLDSNNYIKLISRRNNFIEVPAIRLTVVPEYSTERRRRSSTLKILYDDVF